MQVSFVPGRLNEVRPIIESTYRDEVPSLVEEIVEEIRETIPEYARRLDGPYGQALRAGVERNVYGFIEWTAARPALDARDDICRRLGQFEAIEGRSLASLQAAYRIGARASWRRIESVIARHTVSPAAVAALAEALHLYIDELSQLSSAGYRQAKAEIDERRVAARRQLIRALLQPPGPDRTQEMLARLVAAADWTMPDEATLIALPPEAPVVRTMLDDDILFDLTAAEPYLLVPGRLTADRRAVLEISLADTRAAAGLTVPLDRARDSLRWARRALAAVDERILADGTLTLCEDHLVTLWLLADRALLEQIARRRLAFLGQLTERQRERLTETLRAWLRTRGPATRMSEDLGVHVQTVRYRMRKLDQYIGDELSDPDVRFTTEAVLRALWLLERAEQERALPAAAR
jgi:PucR-like helix-turn-helix protein